MQLLRRAPLLAAGGSVALLVALAGRYGWHRDELYFLQSGRRLEWGFVDQPPLTPAVARAAEALFGTSLVGLRLFPALAIGATVLFAAAIAREMGGRERAAAIAAIVTAATPLFLGMGHLLSTATFDLLAWTVILWLVVRLVRGGDQRLWVAVGVAFGVGFLNKHSVVFLAAGLAVGFLLTSARRFLATPWLGLGVVIAAAIAMPNVAWQATHDWPVLEMMRSLSDESALEDHVLFLPTQLAQTALAVGVWGPGLVWSVRGGGLRWRWLAIAYAALVVVFVVTGGKPYYLAGMYPTLIAAGGVQWENVRAGPWPTAVVAVGSVAAALVLALPAMPLSFQREHPIEDLEIEAGAQLGWEEMVERIAAEVRSLREGDGVTDVAIYTQNYGQAGAVDLFGPALGLPRAASPHNNYWWWGPPRDAEATVVVGVHGARLDQLGATCELRHTFAAPHGVQSEEAGTPLYVCRDFEKPWRAMWDDVRLYAA